MPTISMFYGILIKMNWKDKGQHNLPHFHAYYGEYEALTVNFWRESFQNVRVHL